MSLHPLSIIDPIGPLSPLVVDSPHSGRIYPDDFHFICPLPMLRQTEDYLVDELVTGAVEAGATVIAASFPRSYIDTNRAENDIDPLVLADGWFMPLQLTERTGLGLGLVRRLCMAGVPVYAAPLSAATVMQRIENYYRPYHTALAEALQQRLNIFGMHLLLNCHSMPSHSFDDHSSRPDFILGDRDGSSCDAGLLRMAQNLLQDVGYSVAVNAPYKGMDIIRRHGKPEAGRHALQIEINRRLYMDERRLEKNDGFVKLQNDMTRFFNAMSACLLGQTAPSLAAE